MSTDLSYVDPGQASAALAAVRSNADPTDWALFTYASAGKNQIELVGTGSGGLEELKTHLSDDKICYGLFRVEDRIDHSTTIKFVFLVWCGEKVSFVQRGKMSTHKGSIVSLIGQFHNDIFASNLNEINFEEIMKRITDASGSGNRVRDKPAETKPTSSSSSGYRPNPTPPLTSSPSSSSITNRASRDPKQPKTESGVTGAQDLPFSDEAALRAVINDVRNDHTETNWMALGYEENRNAISLIGSGNGGLEEMYGYLSEQGIAYALLRVTDVIDESVTVKFVFIAWVGDKVPFVRKARITTHRGAVVDFIGQHHASIDASNLSELTHDIIVKKISDASGSGNRVKGAPTSTGTSTAAKPTAKGSSKVSAGSVVFINEQEIRAAIAKVRSDANPTDWVLLGYEGTTNKVILVGHGDSGLPELLPYLEPDKILYGLYRTTDLIDNSITVKFVLIIWVGEDVPTVRKARIVTHKGDITSFIGQYHVDVTASNLSEIDDEIIRGLVQDASGSAVHVKNK